MIENPFFTTDDIPANTSPHDRASIISKKVNDAFQEFKNINFENENRFRGILRLYSNLYLSPNIENDIDEDVLKHVNEFAAMFFKIKNEYRNNIKSLINKNNEKLERIRKMAALEKNISELKYKLQNLDCN